MPSPRPRAPYWRDDDEHAVCRRRSRGAGRDAGRVGRLHRHQPALLGQTRLPRGRAVRPRTRPGQPTSDTLRATFTEARRVLADDGTCWLNLGDSYSAGGGRRHRPARLPRPQPRAHRDADLPAKNLLGLPWRVAFALQDDGWILRNAIVWHKPNAMPESVRDRLNCRYELIFLLVKQPAYWFDLDPIRIPPATTRPASAGPPRPQDPGRPPKYGPHARQVTGAQRYGTGRSPPRAPERP